MSLWDSIKSGFNSIGNFVTGGGEERKLSEQMVKRANNEQSEAKENLEKKRESTNDKLMGLGYLREQIQTGVIRDFVEIYETIALINRSNFISPDDSFDAQPGEFKKAVLPELPSDMKQAVLGGGMGALGGAAAAYGAYGLAGMIGTASTGTAISTLSGAAATNATLAWLGGGAAAAGGLGTLGGSLVLGGIALIPAAIVAMYFSKASAEKKLNEARNYRDQVEVFVSECTTFILQLDKIEQAADFLTNVLLALEPIVKNQNDKLRLALTDTMDAAQKLQELLAIEIIGVTGAYLPDSAFLSNDLADDSAEENQGIIDVNNQQFHDNEGNEEITEKNQAEQERNDNEKQ